MYGIDSEPPKNCMNCPLCQGEYGCRLERRCGMNNDLISRGALKKAIIEHRYDYVEDNFFWTKLFNIIDNAPTVEAEKAKESEIIKAYTKGFDTGVETVKNERPQGEWKETIYGFYTCSICGNYGNLKFFKFCPYCGADMRGEE